MDEQGDGTASQVDGQIAEGAAQDVELGVFVENDECIVVGPTEAALRYVDAIRSAGATVSVAELSARRAADAAAALAMAGAVHSAATGGVYLKVAAESVPTVMENGLLKSGANFLAMAVRDGKISGHVRFAGMTLDPVAMANLELMAVQMALRMAVNEVGAAVERVDGKVDALLVKARAQDAGDVLGLHSILRHHSELLESSGSISRTDWMAVASAVTSLSMVVERLRKHALLSTAKLDADLDIDDRAKELSKLLKNHRIDETMALLLIAEDALFHYQRLRIAHTEQEEPERVDAVIESARQILATNYEHDLQLYETVLKRINDAARVEPLEILSMFAVPKLARHAGELREHLESFAASRELQGGKWQESRNPKIKDAVREVAQIIESTGDDVAALGSKVVDVGYNQLDQLGQALQEMAVSNKEKSKSKAEKKKQKKNSEKTTGLGTEGVSEVERAGEDG